MSKTSDKIKIDKHGNEVSNSKVKARFTKAKKVITDNSTNERIKTLAKKRGKPKNAPINVLHINDWLYITCDSNCWKLMEVIDKLKDGKRLDKPLKYSVYLNDMLKICVRELVAVPDNLNTINDNINKIYSLIDSRIPPDISPKKLFKLEVRSNNDD